MTLFQTLLVRKRTLAGLIAELREDVKRRRPAEPRRPEIKDPREPFGESVLEPGDLFRTVLISSKEDLDSWLTGIRGKLTELIEAGKRVKVVGGDK